MREPRDVHVLSPLPTWTSEPRYRRPLAEFAFAGIRQAHRDLHWEALHIQRATNAWLRGAPARLSFEAVCIMLGVDRSAMYKRILNPLPMQQLHDRRST